ncbi:E3 SUMO-protein ligase ZBED1-like [Dysidea avara]|uniref:E3 SUMO-protein ligase ZBED1-like n=1 Tax=Dysidea avara TaxID=196820 RepID=UPI0033180648
MAGRVLNQQQPIRATLMELKKGELMPTDGEFKTLEHLVKVMKPFVDITEALGAEKWVTVSTLTPLLYKILNVYLKVSSDDDRVVVSMKEAMYRDLSGQYHGTQRVVLNKAAFLDARFKSLPFLKPEEKDDIATAIVEEIVRLTPVSQRTNDDTDSHDTCTTPKPKRPRGEHVLLEILSDVFIPTTTGGNEVLDDNSDPPRLQASLEMKAYLKEETTDDSPLQWWKRNAFRYPLLSKIARR